MMPAAEPLGDWRRTDGCGALRAGDVVLTLGAGDITRVAPELVRWLSAA